MEPRRRGLLLHDELHIIPKYNTYATFQGPRKGMPSHVYFWPESYFNEPFTNETIIYMCRKLPLYDHLNLEYRRPTPIEKDNVEFIFDLPPEFIGSFTPSWGVVTITQVDLTTGRFYQMAIIHNGRYNGESTIFAHMNGVDENIQIFEVTNYDRHEDIPLGRFNVEWNNFGAAMDLRVALGYKLVDRDNYNDFHRGMQYMLLSFYINPQTIPSVYVQNVKKTEGREVSPEERSRVSRIHFHIQNAKSVNCLMKLKLKGQRKGYKGLETVDVIIGHKINA